MPAWNSVRPAGKIDYLRGLELIPAEADLASGGLHGVVHVPVLDTPYGIVVIGEAIHQTIAKGVQLIADTLLRDAIASE